MKRSSLILVLFWFIPRSVLCYELGTHALVTKTAFDRSVLSPTSPASIRPILGFDRIDQVDPWIGTFPAYPEHGYQDNEPTSAPVIEDDLLEERYIRSTQELEGNIFSDLIESGYFPDVTSVSQLEHRIDGWLMRGAIREDDFDVGPFSDDTRDDDPFGYLFRVTRHFYDPIGNSELTEPGACLAFGCEPTVEWAIGRTNVLSGPGTIDSARDNHFSYQDARNHYWLALTQNRFAFAGIDDATMRAATSQIRDRRFATMLKSIGHVIHLIQDMSQPQHVRDDAHGPPKATLFGVLDAAGDGSFEAFTEARVFRRLPEPSIFDNALQYFTGGTLSPDELPEIKLRGAVEYPKPTFTRPEEFFTTQVTDGTLLSRRGIADLTNRSFFSASTKPINVQLGQPRPSMANFLLPPRPSDQPLFYTELAVSSSLFFDGQPILVRELVGDVADVLAPSFNQASGLVANYGTSGKAPLLAKNNAQYGFDLINGGVPLDSGYSVWFNEFIATADLMLPRAAAYSAGMIDYFFRGRLEITPPNQNVFAVMNQGEAHTVDQYGYPRRADQRIFGFEKVRLKVRNITEAITESGSTSGPVNQVSGSGILVAVARYHRNACYRADMSGERTTGYPPPPAPNAVITEPSCGPNLPQRTDFQEISVSAPITISSDADLPGGSGSSSPAAVDKVFDFSADPIPVNATDLFIQVVYRGQLGEEPDGIAVGIYDVREPTFVGIYNNTDYFWNHTQSAWIPQAQNQTYARRNVDFLRVCVGAGGESRWAYFAEPVSSVPPLVFPAPDPGSVRLGLLLPIPATPTQQFSVRVTPVSNPGTSPAQRSYGTRGAIRQGNKERLSTQVIAAPQNCSASAPTGIEYWCNDPIQRRRGIRLGHLFAPIYFDTGAGAQGADPDSVSLPVFSDQILHSAGTVKFNEPTLSACPAAPTSPEDQMAIANLLEVAADNGLLPSPPNTYRASESARQ